MGGAHTREREKNMNSANSKGPSSNENPSSRRPLSIEGPRRDDGANGDAPGAGVPDRPRQPANLHGLLRFAVEATKAEDAPHSSRVQPLDEERKRFLNEALDSITVNTTEELRKAVKALSSVVDLGIEDDPTEYESALEKIADSVDSMDIANDFYKIGGFAILGPCLNSPHGSIRWKVADIIAELAQNNPFCQERILEMGLMPVLLSMVDTDTSEQARIKALYAVSCIVRGHPLSLRYMDINDGYSVLLRALQSPTEKLRIKSAFLLCSLCSRDDPVGGGSGGPRETLVKMGLIEQVSGILRSESLSPDTREQTLGILDGLTSGSDGKNSAAIRECRRAELGLESSLDRHLGATTAEDSADEAQLCRSLLDRIFHDQDTGGGLER